MRARGAHVDDAIAQKARMANQHATRYLYPCLAHSWTAVAAAPLGRGTLRLDNCS